MSIPSTIVDAIHRAVRQNNFEMLREAALDASKFLRGRLTEAAYTGICHHCDEVHPGEPCEWCGLVRLAGGPVMTDPSPLRQALEAAYNELWRTYGETPRLRPLFDEIEQALAGERRAQEEPTPEDRIAYLRMQLKAVDEELAVEKAKTERLPSRSDADKALCSTCPYTAYEQVIQRPASPPAPPAGAQDVEAERDLLRHAVEEANRLIADLRTAIWEILPGIRGEDRTLVGMVKLIGQKLDEARDNRRGEYELRDKAEHEAADWKGRAEVAEQHLREMIASDRQAQDPRSETALLRAALTGVIKAYDTLYLTNRSAPLADAIRIAGDVVAGVYQPASSPAAPAPIEQE